MAAAAPARSAYVTGSPALRKLRPSETPTPILGTQLRTKRARRNTAPCSSRRATKGCRSHIFLNQAYTAFFGLDVQNLSAGREVTCLESQDEEMRLSHTHDLICHFKRCFLGYEHFCEISADLETVFGEQSPVLLTSGGTVGTGLHVKETSHLLRAGGVPGCPLCGLGMAEGLEQHLSLFQGPCENFPTLCLWEVKGTFSKPFLS
ncbi:uncharacterized protein [Taeniopygia guttata]|uniref:uncharacterized protein n=1 Tax=Taeniopygia guttata TaxID=59729 RepID=UPI003BB94BD2